MGFAGVVMGRGGELVSAPLGGEIVAAQLDGAARASGVSGGALHERGEGDGQGLLLAHLVLAGIRGHG